MKSTRRMTKGMFTILLGLTVVVFASETFAQGTWATKAPMPTARAGPAVGVVNGILYAVGGANGVFGSVLSTVEAYDPATDTWTTKTSMPTARYGLGVGVVNGILYAVGGSSLPFCSGAHYATVEAYDPATNTWTTKASMPTGLGWHGVGVVNAVLYAMGGLDNSTSIVTTVEAYDPATDTWTTKNSMTTPRYALAAEEVNGILYAVGGLGYVSPLATLEAYDPTTDTWTTQASMSTARGVLAAGVVNGILYAVGGYDGSILATNEAFTPPDCQADLAAAQQQIQNLQGQVSTLTSQNSSLQSQVT